MLQRTFRFHAVGLVFIFTLIDAADAIPPAYTMSVNNYGSTTLHEISIYAGHAFSVYINLNVPGQIFTAGARLHSSASDVFDVTGGLYLSPWTPFGSIAAGGVDPMAPNGLDAALPYPSYFGPGQSTLALVTLVVDSNAVAGDYTLNLLDVQFYFCRICPAYIVGQSGPDFVVHVLASPFSRADFNHDTRVDEADFDHLSTCRTAPGVQSNLGCLDADLDGDLDVDLDDFGVLQRCYNPGIAADVNCH